MDTSPLYPAFDRSALSGRVVGGYRVGQQIASSDMGDVYLATQLSMNRKVALKVLSDALTHDHEMIQTFLNEVRLLAQMEHPHIVTAIDSGFDEGVYFLVMSFVGGEDLASRIERRGPMSARKAVETMHQVAKAMAYAWNAHQVLHRDIKPSNIMVTRDGMAKVLDMGVSVQSYIDGGGVLGQDLVGTPHYLSPERILGTGDATVRSEIYSLGATFYHAVTGVQPYRDVPVERILAGEALPDLPPASRLDPKVPGAVSELIEHMMMRHPNLRPGSWEELLKLISDVQENLVQSEAVRRERLDTRLDFKPEDAKAVDHTTEAERQEQEELADAARIRAAKARRRERDGVHPMAVPVAVVAAICVFGTCFLYFAAMGARESSAETPADNAMRREGIDSMSLRLSEDSARWQGAAEVSTRSAARLQAVQREPDPETDATDGREDAEAAQEPGT